MNGTNNKNNTVNDIDIVLKNTKKENPDKD